MPAHGMILSYLNSKATLTEEGRREEGKELDKSEIVFIGIDLHKRTWHVTIRTFDIELFTGSIPGLWKNLEPLLKRYSDHKIIAVYEAGLCCFSLSRKPHISDTGL